MCDRKVINKTEVFLNETLYSREFTSEIYIGSPDQYTTYAYKQYIEGNNKIKAEATKSGNRLLRQLAKDLSNIIYGKNIQNILKQRDYEIVYVPDNNTVTRLNYIDKINSMKKISDKLIIVEKGKKKINLNMSIYIGKAILDLTKHLMYDFFYNVVIKSYSNAKLLYMGTDSFIIEIPDTVEGLSRFVLESKKHFDLSECESRELPLYDHLHNMKKEFRNNKGYCVLTEEEKDKLYKEKKKPTVSSNMTNDEYEVYLTDELWKEEYEEYINSGTPGKFKSETKWYSIEEFLALRPKQYSYITENNKQASKAKGLSKDALKKHVKEEIYQEEMKEKNISKEEATKNISKMDYAPKVHQKYVDQVLKDEKIVNCKMSNIQSKNFNMYTQYIYKRALINYENKRYWLDSIYSLPFGHPWIKKIENGTMKLEDAVDQLRGEDNYTYELNAYKLEVEKKEKTYTLSNGYTDIINLTEDQLNLVTDNCNGNLKIKKEMEAILANPNGLKLFKDIITGNICEEKVEEEKFDF